MTRRLAARLKISTEQVVREYWEIWLLKGLFDSALGDRLVFKGGTALRLAHGSPRFSDDLDFSLRQAFPFRTFSVWARRLASTDAEFELTDLVAKHYTFLAEFKVTDNALPRAFRVVIEVSRRNMGEMESELGLITSPCSPLTVLGRVATLEALWQEKLQALRTRGLPRDLFDLWFLSQKLRQPLPADRPRIDPRVLRRDLRKYLPHDYYPVIEELAAR
ncbi:MAG: nucleotidyl transferase AbiEii/AbiGii toxin family protein [candidate division WOR-3 bacterium]